jgi:hypothetical protein
MGVQIAEMVGGLIQLALTGALIWGVAELGSRIFFWIREGKGE